MKKIRRIIIHKTNLFAHCNVYTEWNVILNMPWNFRESETFLELPLFYLTAFGNKEFRNIFFNLLSSTLFKKTHIQSRIT